MRLQDIIGIIRDRFFLGLVIVVAIGIILAIGYFLIYRKLLGGARRLDFKKVMVTFAFLGYIIMVFGITFMGRGDHFKGSINLHFLSSYRNAWNSFGLTAWQQLIFNIIMFLPFGILLPLISPRFDKLKNIILATLSFTVVIEVIQLITGFGVFEIDDIFNNLLGGIIGYGLIMVLIIFYRDKEKDFKKLVKYLSPLFLTILVFLSIFTYYSSKEFGNVNLAYSYRLNMKNVDVSLNRKLSSERAEVTIYKAPSYDKKTGREFALNFFNKLGLDTEDLEVNQYSNTGIYWLRDETSYNIWLDYKDGSYSYSDFSSFDKDIEVVSTDRDILIEKLEAFNIDIPSQAVFNEEENMRYSLAVEREALGDDLREGTILCTYYSDGTIKDISNNLVTYRKVRDIPIKSEKEAYEDLLKGKFSYENFGKDIKSIVIKNVELDYYLDTKGYYQPVYSFDSLIQGREHKIIIPAL